MRRSSAGDMVRLAQVNLIRERAGIVSARQNAQAIAALRAPAGKSVGGAPAITSAITTGDALRDVLGVLDQQGVLTDQSQYGDDGIQGIRDDSVLPSGDHYTLIDGMTMTYSDESAAWIPSIPPFGFPDFITADNAVTASTTNAGTYVEAYTLTLALPVGVYDVRAQGQLLLMQGSGFDVKLRVMIDGTVGGGRIVPTVSTGYQRGAAHYTKLGVLGGRDIDIVIQYTGTVGGTSSAANPSLVLTYTRTA